MSKVEHLRPRHLLLRVRADRPVPRAEFQEALRARLRAAAWQGGEVRLTRYAAPYAAVQVEHTHAPRLRALAGGDWGRFQVETLRTSGTLRALTEKSGVPLERLKPGAAPGPGKEQPVRSQSTKPHKPVKAAGPANPAD